MGFRYLRIHELIHIRRSDYKGGGTRRYARGDEVLEVPVDLLI